MIVLLVFLILGTAFAVQRLTAKPEVLREAPQRLGSAVAVAEQSVAHKLGRVVGRRPRAAIVALLVSGGTLVLGVHIASRAFGGPSDQERIVAQCKTGAAGSEDSGSLHQEPMRPQDLLFVERETNRPYLPHAWNVYRWTKGYVYGDGSRADTVTIADDGEIGCP